MLFQALKHWRCSLQGKHFSLEMGGHRYYQITAHTDIPLNEQIAHLVSKIPGNLPWLNSIEFILDVPYVQYALIPWQDGLHTPAEHREYAAALIETQHNISVEAMKITFFNHHYGEDAFAAAMESTLFVTLKTIALNARLRFHGCSTPFTSLLNKANNKLPEDIVLARIGEDISSYAIRYQNRWHSVLSLHIPEAEDAKQIKIISQLVGVPELPWIQASDL
ncbi:hypothetical protein RZ87_02585 [Enterobacter roggenkampii]|nr:hypothetical protein RZ87_02585 [Enterobacter roggenkampii]